MQLNGNMKSINTRYELYYYLPKKNSKAQLKQLLMNKALQILLHSQVKKAWFNEIIYIVIHILMNTWHEH